MANATKSVNFRLTERQLKELKKDARTHDFNVSQYIRYLISKERKESKANAD